MRGVSLITSRRTEASYDGIARVRLYLSGGFRAFRDDDEIPSGLWDRRTSARTVIKILAMAPDHRMHREQMLETIWPDLDRSDSLNRLGKALHAARRILEPALPAWAGSSYLTLDGELLSLHPVNVWVDVDEFEFLARSALGAGTLLTSEAARAAYSGELLPEDRYADWAAMRRESVRALYLEVLHGLAAIHEGAGEFRQAIGYMREALSIDNTPEETHCSLIRLYALDGKPDRALRQFQRLKEILQRDLGVAPNRETQALCTSIREGTFPPSPVTPGTVVSGAK